MKTQWSSSIQYDFVFSNQFSTFNELLLRPIPHISYHTETDIRNYESLGILSIYCTDNPIILLPFSLEFMFSQNSHIECRQNESIHLAISKFSNYPSDVSIVIGSSI